MFGEFVVEKRIEGWPRADNAARNNAIRSCFWPGPKLRTGFYTTDPDDYGLENQIPDTMKARGLTRDQVINDVLLERQPTKQFVQPEDCAALALFLCRHEARNITGANYNVDGGYIAT